ncbi:hypothetical protein NIASO_20280 [Niabella soli DSM 19437]|uniref:Uncharacterized protein n=1 Tax=Niabella soli DSM 19437 TaxID=929713 RepID=W0F8E3_9BACT|nr:hypothetical protein NIASO_20280 [Niabella soli DSM 19437]
MLLQLILNPIRTGTPAPARMCHSVRAGERFILAGAGT